MVAAICLTACEAAVRNNFGLYVDLVEMIGSAAVALSSRLKQFLPACCQVVFLEPEPSHDPVAPHETGSRHPAGCAAPATFFSGVCLTFINPFKIICKRLIARGGSDFFETFVARIVKV